MTDTKKNPLKWRSVTTLTLASAFVVLATSGAVLYIAPKCRVAEETGWTALALDKDTWSAFHVTSTITLLITSILHLYFNWGLFLQHLRKRLETGTHLQREVFVALAILLIVLGGTYWRVPPFSTVVEWHESIKASWGEPRDFADGHGRGGRGQRTTTRDTPEESAAGFEEDKGGEGSRGQGTGGSGWGRMTLEEACAVSGVSLETAQANLKAAGIEAGPEDRIKTLAGAAGVHPREIGEILRGDGGR